MAELTQDRNTMRREGAGLTLGIAASTKVFAGGIACRNATGYAVPGSTSTTLKALGAFQAQADNSAGGDGGKMAQIRKGTFCFGNSASTDAITIADIGNDCYIVDDQTVAKTSGTSTRSVAGTVADVDSTGVWVTFA
ncbi:MAG: hypothetical protein RBR06_06100 [Desulfuromonadaceae bacterium]|nr:hypothetical protein [Desulfuromonadaceae bacterium]